MTEDPRLKSQGPRTIIVCLFLLIAIFALFFRVGKYPFIGYDDPFYVVNNPHVVTGLTWDNIVWAFTSLTSGFTYWHPLAWMSHMMDCQLFGLNAGGHHLMNLAFHGADVLLLFWVLRKLTGAFWRSAAVATLFALHPLQVESVAWVTERKNLLSTLFMLLTIWAYQRYVKKLKTVAAIGTVDTSATGSENVTGNSPASGGLLSEGIAHFSRQLSNFDYWLPIILFALGLMCKPMLVSVPLVLLILDVWPLQRAKVLLFKTPGPDDAKPFCPISLVIEKTPFFVLSLISGGITVLSHEEFQSLSSSVPFFMRIQNALLSYSRYLKKVVWPNDLAVVYPFPMEWPMSRFLICLVLIGGVTALVLWTMRKRPYLAFGWFWFLATLLPVIGLIQAGSQAMADRFVYMPVIGLFVMVVWGVAELLSNLRVEKIAGPALIGVTAVVCFIGSSRQLDYWKDSVALFTHSVAVEPGSPIAQYNLGFALQMHDKADDAKAHYEEAARISSSYFEPRNNLAFILDKEGKTAEAVAIYEKFLANNPKHVMALCNAAVMLDKMGKSDEAMAHLETAVAADPKNAEAQGKLGNALARRGKMTEAAEHFWSAVQLDPNSAQAHLDIGNLLMQQQKIDEAIQHFADAARLQPGFADAHYALGNALAMTGRMDPALQEFTAAAKLRPQAAESFYPIAMILERTGRVDDAIKAYNEALRHNPEFVPALIKLGWIFASNPNPKIRNGANAVDIATHVVQLTQEKNPEALNLLGAAYAESGKFAEAAAAATKASSLAEAVGQQAMTQQIQARLQLYKQEKSFQGQ